MHPRDTDAKAGTGGCSLAMEGARHLLDATPDHARAHRRREERLHREIVWMSSRESREDGVREDQKAGDLVVVSIWCGVVRATAEQGPDRFSSTL